MANLALYRKYRPRSFGEVIGQEHVVQTLRNALMHGMVSHAYLFCGPRGSGKTTLARLLAKTVNCENLGKDREPCNKCSACQEINLGRAMDLVEIDAASNRGIDEIRELKEGIKFMPVKLKYKVFVVDEAHQLTKEAANALLKTLEEPPSHAIFILATTETHKMMGTIVSRCQRFDFRKLRLEEIVQRLGIVAKKENLEIEKSALELIALSSGGSFRDAESILDKVSTSAAGAPMKRITADQVKELLGLVDINLVTQLTQLLLEKKGREAMKFLSDTLEQGSDPHEFAKALVTHLRYAFLVKISPDLENVLLAGYTKEQKESMKKQTSLWEERDLQKAVELFLVAENKMKFSYIPQLPLELAIIETTERK